jgi:hypothetical protein
VATVAPPEGSKRSKTKGAVRKRWSGNPEGGLCPHHKHELVWPRRDDGGALSEEEGSEGFGPVVRENVPRQSVLNTKTHHEAAATPSPSHDLRVKESNKLVHTTYSGTRHQYPPGV